MPIQDFNKSFAELINTTMNAGWSGPYKARKIVYAENTKIFNNWKVGKSDIEFGDYTNFLNGVKLYKKPYNVNNCGTIYNNCTVGCINADCIDVAEFLLKKGYKPAILNLASAKKPGGGYRDGLIAQEESLCYSSNLSVALYQYGDPKYANVKDSGVPHKETAYPLDVNFGGIYAPSVTFFRNGKSKFYTIRKNSFNCDVITVAGLCLSGKSHYADINELSYRAKDGGFTTEGEEIMFNKLRTIFRMGVENGNDSLVLGALGCGAYKCPPEEVAKQFKTVMQESEFKNKFKVIVFAILEKPRKALGLDGKYAPFYCEFGRYELN